MASASLIDEEVERDFNDQRLFVLSFEVEQSRRQALGELLGLTQQSAHERRATVALVTGLGDGNTVEHDGGGEAQRFFAGEIRHLEVLQRDAVLLGDGFQKTF
jgi:hypothetical protein